MKSVGVKPNQIPLLAFLEISGGIGLIVGIWITKLGKISALCLTLYFVGLWLVILKETWDFGIWPRFCNHFDCFI